MVKETYLHDKHVALGAKMVFPCHFTFAAL